MGKPSKKEEETEATEEVEKEEEGQTLEAVDVENVEFETGNAGSAAFAPMQAGCVKKNGYCMIKGFPCKVIDFSTAKPGKHGSAKATIVGVDIFTNKKYEDSCPTSTNIMVPYVSKEEFEAANIDEDGFVSLITKDGTLKEDLKIDESVREEIDKVWQENFGKNSVMMVVQSACGQQKIISARAKLA